MQSIEQSIEVDVPVRPPTTSGRSSRSSRASWRASTRSASSTTRDLHWKATIGGKEHEWDAEITEQTPDERVAWHNTGGAKNAGVVTFHRLDDSDARG